METEIRKTIRLSIEDYKNIEQIRLEHGLADFSKAICYAVQNYPILEKENMKINSNDINIVYIYIKNNFDEILKDEVKVLNRIKNDVNSDTYDKILLLYEKYKDKLVLLKK